MNLFSLRSARSPVGLDLGSRSIKAAQLVSTGAGFRLACGLSMARLDAGPVLSERDARRLGPSLVRAGFRGRTLACALPAELALHTNIELPAHTARAPLDAIARSELARVSPAGGGDLVCAHWSIADADKPGPCPTRVVGAERSRLNALLDSLAEIDTGAGRAIPLAMDTGPWALTRCLAPWLGEARDVAVIADIGWRRCSLTIVQGQRIIYERLAHAVGLEPLRDALAADLGGPPEVAERMLQRIDDETAPAAAAEIARACLRRQAQQLAQEVERSLRFAAERGGDGEYRVILCGGGGSAAMVEALAPLLEGLAEVRRARPGEFVSACGEAVADDPSLICAIGLAMRMDR